MHAAAPPCRVAHLLEEDANELYENAPCGYLSTLPNGTIIKVNTTFLHWTGYARDTLVDKKRFQELLPLAGRIFYDTHFSPLLLMQGFVKALAFEMVRDDGARIPVLLNSTLKRDAAGNPLVIRTTLLDARGRRAYEDELRLAKRKAEDAEASLKRLNESLEQRVAQRTQERDRIWQMSHDMLMVASLRGHFVSFNPAFERTLGWSEQDLQSISLSGLAHLEHVQRLRAVLAQLAAGQPVSRFEIPMRHQDGSYRWLSWTMIPEDELLYAVGRDVTEEKRQADALSQAEAALRQSQKMEAIGKLTGGVAHDFNNILQIIAGNLELLKLEFSDNTHLQHRLKAAIQAVDRGANLAAQLLAFARRQPLQPLPTHLGRALRAMEDLLRRALGEAIELETIVGTGLWTAMVDRHQLENAVLNLAINARDAMQGVGKLTLELGNAVLDDHYAATHAEVTPGQYVMLAVSDTGSGMSQEVMEQVFEPFFTTKPEGEGTGLGLSMVYGFVKQSGGHIQIDSELQHGTTFKIYLPRIHQEAVEGIDMRSTPVTGGSETILVVEDDVAVQATVVDMLTGLGYRVLKARNGQSALAILHSGVAVDLLFTDVVVPGALRTPDLARQAKQLLPDIAILFTSGYTQNAIVHGGKLDPGVELLSKPYRREDLARKLRQMLRRKTPDTAATLHAPPAALPPSVRPRAEDACMPRKKSILVVEDNVDSQQLLCDLLSLLGYAAHGVGTAEKALDLLERDGFDVLLTDVSLPRMSGIDLARKALVCHPAIQVIFSSGHGAVEGLEFDCLSLPKPYNLQQLQQVFAQIGC